jgi:hypothetical protein
MCIAPWSTVAEVQTGVDVVGCVGDEEKVEVGSALDSGVSGGGRKPGSIEAKLVVDGRSHDKVGWLTRCMFWGRVVGCAGLSVDDGDGFCDGDRQRGGRGVEGQRPGFGNGGKGEEVEDLHE